MGGGDSEILADRARSGADDAALWRRFRGISGEDAKVSALQRTKHSGPIPESFSHHLTRLAPADDRRGEAIMRDIWRIGMERLTLPPGQSPWSVALPSKHFADRLHRFSWLADIFEQGEAGAELARRHVDAWIETHGDFNGFSWRMAPTSVRCLNWMLCGRELFETGHDDVRRARVSCLVRQIRYLANQIDAATDPKARWNGSVAIVAGALCIDRAMSIESALARLDAECTAQILPDGGHVSRSPARTLHTLIHLLTLQDLFHRSGHPEPEFFNKWIPRIGAMVAFFRAGDGALAPFNDSDEARPEVVEAALSRLPAAPRRFMFAPKSGFQKLERGDVRLILDCGEAPERPFSDFAHAGALGFDLSDGPCRLVTSCGYSAEVSVEWQAAVRRTGAHSTLVLAGRDSSTFTLNEESRLLAASGPEGISAKRLEEDDEVWLDAQHGGYKSPCSLLHRRRLFMSGDGTRLTGEDSLVRPISQPPSGDRKFIGFEIRFHLHPTVTAIMGRDAILLECDDGAVWKFKTSHEGARLERTVYLSRGVVERPEQIVMAGFADPNGDGQQPPNCIRWAFLRDRAR